MRRDLRATRLPATSYSRRDILRAERSGLPKPLPVPAPSLLAVLGDQQLRVLDIGARGGMARAFRAVAPATHVVGFEPDPEECARLREESAREGWCSAEVHDDALAGTDGTAVLHVLRGALLSSLLEPNPTMRHSADWEVLERRPLATRSIDSLVAASRLQPGFDFVKADTQGSELDILRGASSILPTVLGLEVECRFVEQYLAQPRFSDIEQHLRANGFEVFELRPLFLGGRLVDVLEAETWGTRRRLSHGDAVFLRPPAWIESVPDGERAATARRLLALYLLHGHLAAARALADLVPGLDGPLTAALRPMDAARAGWRLGLLWAAVTCAVRPTPARRFRLAYRTLTYQREPGWQWRLSLPEA